MADLLHSKEDYRLAQELGKLLDEHRGGEVLVLDMRSINFWTDFFIIATVTSNTHLMGLERHIKEFIREKDLEILSRSKRPEKTDEWRLLDLGTMVIHLMTAKSRSFYELERLWSAAPVIWSYSSKSS
ncbi:MAG: ribosome silencing factor [Treponema sp.]|nr:ribosome silencing factor [Treponema sp.]